MIKTIDLKIGIIIVFTSLLIISVQNFQAFAINRIRTNQIGSSQEYHHFRNCNLIDSCLEHIIKLFSFIQFNWNLADTDDLTDEQVTRSFNGTHISTHYLPILIPDIPFP